MKLEVIRFNQSKTSTNGILFNTTNERIFLCYTLEDKSQKEKICGSTYIPEGEYFIGLRDGGGLSTQYSKRFADIHVGMLEVLDVPDFRDILIHCGNTNEDTSGCLLLGDSQENNNTKENGSVGKSTKAYFRVYEEIAEAIKKEEEVTIVYRDFSKSLILNPIAI